MKDSRFTWSDAWIFLSISKRDGSTLDEIIAIADMLNHAIPTDKEIEMGINHLSRAGLICVDRDIFILTDNGNNLHKIVKNKSGGLFTLIDKMKKLLDKQEFPFLEISEFSLMPNESKKAYEIYQKKIQEASRPKHKKKLKNQKRINESPTRAALHARR